MACGGSAGQRIFPVLAHAEPRPIQLTVPCLAGAHAVTQHRACQALIYASEVSDPQFANPQEADTTHCWLIAAMSNQMIMSPERDGSIK